MFLLLTFNNCDINDVFKTLSKVCDGDFRKVSLVNIYLFKVNNRNTRKRCEICSKLKYLSSISIFDFEQVNDSLK